MNKSVNKEFVKSICFVVLWVVIIFSFSMQSGDETIQLFYGGRCGQVKDVVLDSCGALGGVVGGRIGKR